MIGDEPDPWAVKAGLRRAGQIRRPILLLQIDAFLLGENAGRSVVLETQNRNTIILQDGKNQPGRRRQQFFGFGRLNDAVDHRAHAVQAVAIALATALVRFR